MVIAIVIAGTSAAHAAPELTVDDQPFGSVRVSDTATTSTATRTIDIQNTGTDLITIDDIVVMGMAASDFTITDEPTGGPQIPVGDTLSITVVFNPSAAGARTATLRVESNAPNEDATLTGIGTNALIAVTDVTAADFGVVTPGGTGTDTLTISNSVTTNLGPLRVASGVIAGSTWFTFGANGMGCQNSTTCTLGIDIPPSKDLLVRCRPPAGAMGEQTATVTFTSDSDAGGDSVADLTCDAGTPDVNLVTTSVAFGDVAVNPSTPPTRTVTIGNMGTQTLTFTASESSAVYSLGACTAGCTVAPMMTRSFDVEFDPIAPGDVNIDITITTNDPDPAEAEFTIPVTGRGVGAQISAPGSLASFGNIEVGKTSTAQTLTVMNTGNTPLMISNASFTTGATDYVAMTGMTGPQMTPVPAGGSTTWDIVCTPSTHGARPGNFRIVSNSVTQSTVNVTLVCNGEQGVLVVSPISIAFGGVPQGGSDTDTVTLRNSGNVAVNDITHAINPATAGYSIDASTPVPTTLAAGAQVTLTVKFAPTAAATGGPATITFSGTWGSTATTTSAVLSLTGTGLTADFTLDPATLAFGNLRFDTTLDRTFCITNTGMASITIVNPMPIVPAAGTMTNEFSLVGNPRRRAMCGSGTSTNAPLPQTLATNQVLEVTVRAAPANRTGMMAATLTVSNSLGVSRDLPLTAVSTSGAVTLDPATAVVDFGAVDVQGPPPQRTIKITNSGDGPLDLANFQREANPRFTFTLPPATTLAPNGSLDIVVTYAPTTAGPVENIALTHSIAGAINGPTGQSIMIRGRGIDRNLMLLASPTFPDTFRNPGDLAPVRPVRIQNTGEATLKVSAAMITGDAAVWQLVGDAAVDIPQNGIHEFLVRFSPTDDAEFTGAMLRITNDDDARPMVDIPLTGRGIDRKVQFTPDTIQIGFTGVGVPVTFEGALVVTSMNDVNTFRIRAIEIDPGSSFEIGGLSAELELAPRAEQRFSVTFTPEAQGSFVAKARLFLDMDPLSQHEVTFKGTAVFVDAHGGGGCAAGRSGGAGGGALAGLALAALLGLRRRRRAAAGATPAAALAAASALALAPAAASADDIVLSVFDPVPATTSNGFQLQSPDVGASGAWVLSAVVSHATDPLILGGSENGNFLGDYAVISRSTVTNLGAAVAFLGRLEAGARIPLYVQEGQAPGDPTREFTGQPAEGNARGDLALHVKARLVKRRLEGDGAFITGLGGQLTIPTATPGQFAGVERPSGRVALLGSLMPGAFERRLTLTMNLGAVLRSPATYANLEQKSGVAWGLGVEIRALDALWLAGEVYGDTVPSGRTDAMTQARVLSPIEWLGGLRWRAERRVTVGLAAGRGLTSAVGTPAFRGVLSLTLTAGASEVRPIRVPKPEGDADGDRVGDRTDRCPSEAEDADLFDDTDGCPDPDNDGDRIADAQDKCPIEAEDADGVEDADGCVDKDNDGDHIADTNDKCPMQAEDADGFADTDGCPDPDNDRDGLADAADKCPTSPETINGKEDDDGCPDKGDSLVVLSPDRLDMLDVVQFTANHKVAKASNNLLAQVGATLRARTEIARLRVTVHVQPTDDPDRDQEISDKRAAAVREWLVAWGVAPERLEMRGFGGTKPLVPPERKESATLNPRVELIILERK